MVPNATDATRFRATRRALLKNATLKKLSKLSYAFRRFQTLPDAALMLLNATLRHAALYNGEESTIIS